MQPPNEQAVKIVGGAVVLLLAVWFGLENRWFEGQAGRAVLLAGVRSSLLRCGFSLPLPSSEEGRGPG